VRIAFIGDSFTEGLGDEQPDGSVRGWADRVVDGLAASGQEVWYTNFAIRGRMLPPIAGEQLDDALALDPLPDLIVVNGGGNDMMRPNYSTERCAALLKSVVVRTEAAGVALLVLSGPNPADHLFLSSTFHRRGRELTDAIPPLIAGHAHARFVSCYDDQELRDGRYWSDDRMHLNPLGHARVAAIVLSALGVATPMPDPGEPVPRRTARTDLAYTRRIILPWAGRRLRGISAGDGRSPKFATWTEIAPPGPETA